jgi:hypothetical protein
VESRDVVGALAALTLLFAACDAGAFCRTTTCDADGGSDGCATDADGCATQGHPLYWPTECLSFSVQKDGSPKRHIPFSTFDQLVRLAFQEWGSVDCGGGLHPSFRMWDFDTRYGPLICDEPEYNDSAPNAEGWMFRDSGWPYEGVSSTLALTTITFEVESGKILDADVELNSYAADLTTSDTDVHADVQSIATHEAGHFLGLAHSRVSGATMYATYAAGDLGFRTLSADDDAAICAVYPPDHGTGACTLPQPAHGFSRYCATDGMVVPKLACSVGPTPGAIASRRALGAEASIAGICASAVHFLRRRRRQRR